MTEADVETILQRGREAAPGVTPRIISDNARRSWPASSMRSSAYAG